MRDHKEYSQLVVSQSIALAGVWNNPNLSKDEVSEQLKGFNEIFYYIIRTSPESIPIS
jgi:hypothetical protein